MSFLAKLTSKKLSSYESLTKELWQLFKSDKGENEIFLRHKQLTL